MAELNVVVGCRPWNRSLFLDWRILDKPPGEWVFCENLHVLPANARRIFFVNWLTKVPESLWKEIECIAFHAGDLPRDRGASPIQHQILRRHESTFLTAFRLAAEMDAGPIYTKCMLSLLGTAEEIYLRAARHAHQMMAYIVEHNVQPEPQVGAPTPVLRRRKPEESAIPPGLTQEQVFDFIRMLDCEGFPPAFVNHGAFRFEFTRASLRHDRIEANVVIRSRAELP